LIYKRLSDVIGSSSQAGMTTECPLTMADLPRGVWKLAELNK